MCWRLNEKQNGHLPCLMADVKWLCKKRSLCCSFSVSTQAIPYITVQNFQLIYLYVFIKILPLQNLVKFAVKYEKSKWISTDNHTWYNLQVFIFFIRSRCHLIWIFCKVFAKHMHGVDWDYHHNLGLINHTSFLLNYLSRV